MKITDKLKPRERVMVGIILTLFLMLASIICASFNYVIVDDIVSWEMALLLAPFVLFAILMTVYDILWDKEHHS